LPKKYTIGTRGSLLALTQCTQIKNILEEVTGDQFELKVIKTQGDMNTSVPLWQMEGKDFFTKELDQELLAGDIDLVVHSYKDLGSDRPDGITLAAVTKRSYAHDILLIKKETIKNIDTIDEFIVGTSSPRRIVNVEDSLSDFLPSKKKLTVKTQMLRGNVNTRIGKLQEDNYHAIVLALPGIERLALSEDSLKELKELTNSLTFMVLPQSIFPSSASQGALGIECSSKRNDNGELFEKLKKVEDKVTVQEVTRERTSFNSYGGGCHLAVGINVKKVGDYYIHTHKGKVDDKVIDDVLLEGVHETCEDKSSVFVGFPKKKLSEILNNESVISCELLNKKPLDHKVNEVNNDLIVSSTYCLEALDKIKFNSGLWASGTKTMRQLAQSGHWVHGTADSLGEVEIASLRSSKAISLLLGSGSLEFTTLTNDVSKSELGNTVPCYTRETNSINDQSVSALRNCKVFYWTSFYQYETYTKLMPEIKAAYHCCGLGKTFKNFQDQKIKVRPFVNIDEFSNWINS